MRSPWLAAPPRRVLAGPRTPKARAAGERARRAIGLGSISWGRLYVDEVEREGADIDAVVRRMAGTDR
jgi:hypothetical protein